MLETRAASQIIFDLDGTLVQTRVASWEVFRQVNAEFHLGVDDEEKYFALLQGNLFERVRQLCHTSEKADAVIAAFLARLGSDYFPAMVPGMVDVVHALAPQSTLAVLSSNHTSVIRRVLTSNGIAFCFAHVFGGDVEPDKTVGIRRFIADAAQGKGRRCSAFYDEGADDVLLAEDQTVLVTDTVGDVEAAIAAGIRAVGVSWGMHSAAQLTAAGVEFVAVWPQELVSFLRPAGAAAASCAVDPAPSTPIDALARSAKIRSGRRGLTVGPAPRYVPVPPPASAAATAPGPGSACGCALPKRPEATMLVAVEPRPVPVRKTSSASAVSDELIDAIRRTMWSV